MLKKSLLLIVLAITLSSAQSLLNFSIGPTWPKDKLIKETDRNVAWNGAAEWGKVFDKRIIIGAKLDFSWHVVRFKGAWDDTEAKIGPGDEIYMKQRSFMVPVSGWVGIDPIPQYRFHPVIHAQVGFNSLFYSTTNYDIDQPDFDSKKNEFKYYYGFYSKFGLDGMFDLGKSASIFAGFEYQIAPLYHKKDNKLEQISYSAPAIRLGVSFLY